MEEHDDNYVRPLDSINHILARVRDYKVASHLHKFLKVEGNDNKLTGWKPPTRDMIKLNTDGDRKWNNSAGCGGILRNHKGEWKGGFSKYVGKYSALLAKFWEMLEGLKTVQLLGYRKGEINCDSMVVVKALEDKEFGFVECVSILRRIIDIIALLDVVIISHVYMHANTCADALANRGCVKKNFVFL